jgi:hypothetical protein
MIVKDDDRFIYAFALEFSGDHGIYILSFDRPKIRE